MCSTEVAAPGVVDGSSGFTSVLLSIAILLALLRQKA
jgi:hypothetical protein